MRRFNNDLNAGAGHAVTGKELFRKNCGTCHELFGEGTRIGPELTTANRKDREALLANIVDPSAVVRREYINYTLLTVDGRVLTGMLAEQDAASVTILDAKNERTRIAREQIDELREAAASLMPDDILQKLTPQERRDLFGYLMQ
jgi:putative heme-binding domain-containing protein